MHAKSLQLCPAFCDPMDCSSPGSSVHGILQARTLEWVVISFSKGSSQPRDQTLISYVPCIGSVFYTTSTPWEAQWNHSVLPLLCLPSFTHVIFKRIVLLVQLVAVGLFSWLWGYSVTSCVFLHPEDGRLGCVHFRATVNIVALPILCLPLGARMYTFLWGNLSKSLFNKS